MFRLPICAVRMVAVRPTVGVRRSVATTKTLKEGDRVPDVIFKARVRDDKIGGENPFTWKDVRSSDLFAKKRAVLFALPGGKSYLWSFITINY